METFLSIFSNVLLFTQLPEWPLVSVYFQMNYLLFLLQNQRHYRSYCQSPNRSKHCAKLTSLFPLLLMWCSAVENIWVFFCKYWTCNIILIKIAIFDFIFVPKTFWYKPFSGTIFVQSKSNLKFVFKSGTYYVNAGGVQSICPLNYFNSFHCIIIKLCENVCWQNISAKFNKQPDPMKHFGVMALELAKTVQIKLVL